MFCGSVKSGWRISLNFPDIINHAVPVGRKKFSQFAHRNQKSVNNNQNKQFPKIHKEANPTKTLQNLENSSTKVENHLLVHNWDTEFLLCTLGCWKAGG
jgi:hypothetical protein